MNIIATERPQDIKFKGKGTIEKLEGKILKGKETKFKSEISEKFSIKLEAHGKTLFVLKVIDDTTLEVDNAEDIHFEDNVEDYLILPKVDQTKVYDAGWKCLSEGKVLAIFPEGGSHDRTDLLPLKAGISIFCLGAIKKYKCNTQMICCGINYYKPHKLRSISILEFGTPYSIEPQQMERYNNSKTKREEIASVMEEVTRRLKDVKLRAKNYEEFLNIHLTRSLYIPDGVEANDKEKLVIERRLSEALDKSREFKDIQELMTDVDKYRNSLKFLHLSDWQVKTIYPSVISNTLHFIRSACIVFIAFTFGLPGIIYVLPFK